MGRLDWGSTRHLDSKLCRQLVAHREQHACMLEGARTLERTFTVYGKGKELRKVEHFRYLVCTLSFDNNDAPAMWGNLKHARAQWGKISKEITRRTAPAQLVACSIGKWLWQSCCTAARHGYCCHHP